MSEIEKPEGEPSAKKTIRKPRVAKVVKAKPNAPAEIIVHVDPAPVAPAPASAPASPALAAERAPRPERQERSERYERTEQAPERQAETGPSGEVQAAQDGESQAGQDNRPPRQHQQNNNRRDRFQNRNERFQNRDRERGQPRAESEGFEEQRPAYQPPQLPPDFPNYTLTELKRMPMPKLLEMAEQLNLHEGVARMRRQDVTFALLKVLTRHPAGVAAEGVLEILPDGYGFLRSADAS